MKDEQMKTIEQQKEFDLSQILEQFETFTRVYPYYLNMLQGNSSEETKEEIDLKSTMKKQD